MEGVVLPRDLTSDSHFRSVKKLTRSLYFLMIGVRESIVYILMKYTHKKVLGRETKQLNIKNK